MTTRFGDTGDVRVTVQAACGTSVLQDSKVVRVLGEFPPSRPPEQAAQLLFSGAQGRGQAVYMPPMSWSSQAGPSGAEGPANAALTPPALLASISPSVK